VGCCCRSSRSAGRQRAAPRDRCDGHRGRPCEPRRQHPRPSHGVERSLHGPGAAQVLPARRAPGSETEMVVVAHAAHWSLVLLQATPAVRGRSVRGVEVASRAPVPRPLSGARSRARYATPWAVAQWRCSSRTSSTRTSASCRLACSSSSALGSVP
jgi:hypothetical protein